MKRTVLILLPSKDKTKKYIRSLSKTVSFVAQILFYAGVTTASMKIFLILVSVLSTVFAETTKGVR